MQPFDEISSKKQDVTCIGLTDLPSLLPTQSSTLYSNNIVKFLLSIAPASGAKGTFGINLEDEVICNQNARILRANLILSNQVIRGAIVLRDGQLLWPAPKIPQPTPTTTHGIAY